MTEAETTKSSPSNSQRETGDENEKIASRVTGLKKTRGSGCGLLEKGDLGSSKIHLEAKATRTSTLRVQADWWRKAESQARERGKPVVLLQLAFMQRCADSKVPHLRWVAMLRSTFTAIWGPLLDLYQGQRVGRRQIRIEDLIINASDQRTFAWHQDYPMRNGPFILAVDDIWLTIVPETYVTPEVIEIMEALHG